MVASVQAWERELDRDVAGVERQFLFFPPQNPQPRGRSGRAMGRVETIFDETDPLTGLFF